MSRKKDLFVNSIGMIPIAEQNVIPTAIWYSPDEFRIGTDAYANAEDVNDVCDNFKIQLGEQEPGVKNPRDVKLADGQYHSIHSLANDYLSRLTQEAEKWVETKGLVKAKRVLVAEPVAIHGEGGLKDDWLKNYRGHLRRIMSSKFEDVDFLPEPFAVFQYYRYGMRHPLVAERKKHVALVLDFGGGTFDVSIIETTAAGDVSNSGRNSRPLAASSIPIGGFSFNREIAQYLLLKQYEGKKIPGNVQEALKKYDELRKNPRQRIDDLRDDYKNFYRNFTKLLHAVEKVKIAVCSLIKDWDLLEIPSRPVGAQINVPVSALSVQSEWAPVRLNETELRDIFVKRLWGNHLKPVITSALKRADEELAGQSISVVLLSGGSANIGWLSNLIREFSHPLLAEATLLGLQGDFQEIVAKGLAIECARKTFNEGDGDFKAVTYNRLCLVLDPDKKGTEIIKYKPTTPDIESASEGVLLPSASALQKHVDGALSWKFRLPHPPKKRLDYYFLSSSLDPNEHANVHNVIDHTVVTPPNTAFDSNLHVKLKVKNDGTAIPSFVYRLPSPGDGGMEVAGRPFYIDMTFGGAASGTSEAYIGVDFGTSNSSISYVDKSAITVYAERSKDSNWDNINDNISELPYPIAAPLAAFMASIGDKDLGLRAIAAIEGFLSFAAYVSYSEYLATKKDNHESKIFKGFAQRSAGPLWALIKACVPRIKDKSYFSKPLQRLVEEPTRTEIDLLVDAIGEVKHQKAEVPPDYLRAIRLLGNIFTAYCGDFQFGFFEDVQKKKFKKDAYEGIFRFAAGSHSPFTTMLSYEGPHPFSEEQSVLVCQSSGRALLLEPLMFWHQESSVPGSLYADLYCYDIEDKSGLHHYKLVGKSSELNVGEDSQFEELKKMLRKIKEEDPSVGYIEGLKFQPLF